VEQADSGEVQRLVVLGMDGEVLVEERDGVVEVGLRVVQFFGFEEEGVGGGVRQLFSRLLLPSFSEFGGGEEGLVAPVDVKIHGVHAHLFKTYYKPITAQ